VPAGQRRRRGASSGRPADPRLFWQHRHTPLRRRAVWSWWVAGW